VLCQVPVLWTLQWLSGSMDTLMLLFCALGVSHGGADKPACWLPARACLLLLLLLLLQGE
jgi:hypothetical protein